MPFYIRTTLRRPFWQPGLFGAGAMLFWALVQVWLTRNRAAGAQLGTLGRWSYVIAVSLLTGGVTGALYWALGHPRLRSSLPLRLLAGTASAAISLAALTLAAGLTKPEGPWQAITRADFVLSTALISLVLGWFIARDPFGLAGRTERVYLTPKAFAALSSPEQARLQLDATRPSDPGDTDPA